MCKGSICSWHACLNGYDICLLNTLALELFAPCWDNR